MGKAPRIPVYERMENSNAQVVAWVSFHKKCEAFLIDKRNDLYLSNDSGKVMSKFHIILTFYPD